MKITLVEVQEGERGASYEDSAGGVDPKPEAPVGRQEDEVGGAVRVLVLVELSGQEILG